MFIKKVRMKFIILSLLVWTFLILTILIVWSLSSWTLSTIEHHVDDGWSGILFRNSELVCSVAEHKASTSVSTIPKLVLFYKFPDYYELAPASGFEIFKSCSKACELTVNITRFAEADVVVFFSHSHIVEVDSVPPTKRPGQIWVFFAVESPPNSGNSEFGYGAWHGLFNWTMTYRYDSEFWHGYVRLERRTQPVANETRAENEKTWRELFSKKQGLVAWFVSNCDTMSKREHYVSKLKKYIPVDVYGKCGTLQCTEYDKCDQMLRTNYKFYLAFENALCKDYVTEKLMKVFKIGGIVPVVRGGAEYDKLFPPNSVINTKNFPSPERLANHLQELAGNEDEYIKMLHWNWEYEIKGPNLPLCKLCERLYKPENVSCVYRNVYAWWSYKICHAAKDFQR